MGSHRPSLGCPRSDGAAERVVGVNGSVQWSGTVPVGTDGPPIMNAVIWMDSRGAPQARRVTDGILWYRYPQG